MPDRAKHSITDAMHLPWRWLLAAFFFGCGLVGFMSGVEVSERNILDANLATQAYYSLGLFILGGMDLGPPVRGPAWGQVLLWVGYFGAPLLTTSAIVDWLRRVMRNQSRWLQSLTDHIVIIGVSDLSTAILEKLRILVPQHDLVVIDRNIPEQIASDYATKNLAHTLTGDITDEYFLSSLRLGHARQVIITGNNDFDNFEAATKVLSLNPELGKRLIIHCNRIRFMRQFNYTRLMQKSTTFNSYQLSARHLVNTVMMAHFEHTQALDTVVLVGFGRFGQIVLEELQSVAPHEIAEIGIIDLDARRRVLVAEEQFELSARFRMHIFEGDIAHPELWQQVDERMDLKRTQPLFLLCTGADDENLRVAMWLHRKYPNSKIMVRSARPSVFATSVSEDTGIFTFGVSQVIQDALPAEWFLWHDE